MGNFFESGFLKTRASWWKYFPISDDLTKRCLGCTSKRFIPYTRDIGMKKLFYLNSKYVYAKSKFKMYT